MNSFLSEIEVSKIGFQSVGHHVMISRYASIYGAENMCVGSHVRIDDFCILSGKINIGDYVHVSAYSGLYGGDEGIDIKDFVNLSARICIYSISDDYSGETLTSPLVPGEYKNMRSEKVVINRQTIIGSGCTILPGVTIAEGCAVGAMSLVNKSTEPFSIYAGIPIKKLKDRKDGMLQLEKEFLEKNLRHE